MRLLLTPILLLGCGDGCGQSASVVDTHVSDVGRRVVVLVLDGVRIEESFGEGESDAVGLPTSEIMPTLRGLVEKHGALVTGAWASGITITAPGHSDMLTGLRHGFGNFPNDGETPGAYLPEVPSLLAALPEGQALLAANSRLVTPLADSLSESDIAPSAVLTGQSDREILSGMREAMTGSDLRLVVANLHQADLQGHSGPSEGYGEKVLDLDASVPSFWAWVQQEPGWADNTTLILVADHGRHRLGYEEAWRDHGDHCAGCRQIPLAFLGAGVAPGVVIEEAYTLEDVGQTIAHLLDIPLPYGTGEVIEEVLVEPSEQPALLGPVELAASGDLSAHELRTGERSPRALVVLDGAEASDTDAIAAEAPAVISGDAAEAACWRELSVLDETEWPWRGLCHYRASGGDWLDIGSPNGSSPVWALWRPGLALSGERLLVGWVDNHKGVVVEEASEVVLSSWEPVGGWSQEYAAETGGFPIDPALGLLGETALLAVAASEDGNEARDTRRIDLHSISLADGSAEITAFLPAGASADGAFSLDVDRLEHPALHTDADTAQLAFTSYTLDADSAVTVGLWRSILAEGAWSEPVLQDEGLLGHVPSRFGPDGTLYWIRQDGGSLSLCAEGDCTDLEASEARGLAVGSAGPQVAVLTAERRWVVWPDAE